MNAHLCAASFPQPDLNPGPNPPRSHSEALRDLDYLIRLNQRHRRLYGRLNKCLRFLELLAGAIGLATAVAPSSISLAATGGLLALVGLAGFAIEPSKHYHTYHLTLQRYSRLRAAIVGRPEIPLNELEQHIGRIEDPDYIESLRLPSFNDMMRSHGLNQALPPLNRWQRLCAALA